MGRGPKPAWSEKNCDQDDVVATAIEAGAGVPVICRITDETENQVLKIKRGIYACGRHRKISVQVSWPYRGIMTSKSEQWPPDQVNGGYELTVIAHPKTRGRQHVVTVHGTDRSQWPYDPRTRG